MSRTERARVQLLPATAAPELRRLQVDMYAFGQQLDGGSVLLSLMASVLPWKAQGSPVDLKLVNSLRDELA